MIEEIINWIPFNDVCKDGRYLVQFESQNGGQYVPALEFLRYQNDWPHFITRYGTPLYAAKFPEGPTI